MLAHILPCGEEAAIIAFIISVLSLAALPVRLAWWKIKPIALGFLLWWKTT